MAEAPKAIAQADIEIGCRALEDVYAKSMLEKKLLAARYTLHAVPLQYVLFDKRSEKTTNHSLLI